MKRGLETEKPPLLEAVAKERLGKGIVGVLMICKTVDVS
jgi:hypothetical protein